MKSTQPARSRAYSCVCQVHHASVDLLKSTCWRKLSPNQSAWHCSSSFSWDQFTIVPALGLRCCGSIFPWNGSLRAGCVLLGSNGDVCCFAHFEGGEVVKFIFALQSESHHRCRGQQESPETLRMFHVFPVLRQDLILNTSICCVYGRSVLPSPR